MWAQKLRVHCDTAGVFNHDAMGVAAAAVGVDNHHRISLLEIATFAIRLKFCGEISFVEPGTGSDWLAVCALATKNLNKQFKTRAQ